VQALLRHRLFGLAVGLAAMLLGSLGTAGLLILLHSTFFERDETDKTQAVVFDTPPPKKKPKPKKKTETKPKPKPRQSKAPPPPSLGSALAGMSFGLPQFSDDVLGGAGAGLLDDASNVVMDESVVDEPPRPVRRVAADYPTRARAKNIEGRVVFSVLIQADGSVTDVRVLESEPPGVFDAVALEAMRQWQYEPAIYEGQPVAIRARQPFEFRLD